MSDFVFPESEEYITCSSVVVRDIECDYYKLKQPLSVLYHELPDGSFNVFVHELEIFVNEKDLIVAIQCVFKELIILYEFIVHAPLYSIFNEEVMFYRCFLDKYIKRLN